LKSCFVKRGEVAPGWQLAAVGMERFEVEVILSNLREREPEGL
jgi:hypothetical protein